MIPFILFFLLAFLAVGAAVGIVLTLPGLLVRLAHSGGTLATTMWIQ